jgi:peptidylprolyl isomerase
VAAAGIALLVVLGVVFAACSSGDDATTDTTDATTIDAETTSLDDVTVTGAFGEAPTVSFTPAFGGSEDSSRVISSGDGEEVTEGQRVSVNYVAVNGNTGEELESTFGAATQTFTMGGQDLLPIITEALVGQPVGSRVLVATDATASSGSWVLLSIDIVSALTIPTEASGTPVTPRADLPAVTVEDGVPTVATPDGEPPTELVVQPLIEGSGPEVTSGQSVTMQYVGLIWGSGEIFDTSWDSGPVDLTVGTGGVIAGFEEGLIGQKVGSRVMLVIPPDKGYGAEGNAQAGISGTDTLIFVVDILATT